MMAKISVAVVLLSILISYFLISNPRRQYWIDLSLPIDTVIHFPTGGNVTIHRRETSGLLSIHAPDHISFAKGMAFAHCHERYTELFITRLIAQGRLCECLASQPDLLLLDIWMRQMAFDQNARKNIKKISPEILELIQAYSDGINHYLNTHANAIEFVFAGYKPEPWKPEDSLLIADFMTYIGLVSSQLDHEKWIISALVSGNSDAIQLVKKLYRPDLDNVSSFIPNEILQKLRIEVPLVLQHVELFKKIPQISGSNNWVVRSKKSKSGKPIMAFDPHMDISRLPNIWYEMMGTIDSPKTYITGITLPGVFGFVMGRTEKLSLSFTYGYADMVDYFIEDCRNMMCRDGDEYVPVNKTVSVIKRKGEKDLEVVIFRTRNGILELRNISSHSFADGYHLSRAYTHDHGAGGVGTLSATSAMYTSRNVFEFEKQASQIDSSANLLVADIEDNIMYCQTALVPNRTFSGLLPRLGWKKEHQWKGFIPGHELLRITNPEEGFLATANNGLNGQHHIVNAHMGDYRVSRIQTLLTSKEKFSVEDFMAFQSDLYSVQAERFLVYLKPILQQKNDTLSSILLNWDLRYNKESRGAYLFEKFYHKLLETVYGRLVGKNSWPLLMRSIVVTYFHYFDSLLLDLKSEEDQLLWQSKNRHETFLEIWNQVIQELHETNTTELNYGQYHQFSMFNQLYKGVIPDRIAKWLGIHRGPYPFEGSRSTLQQAQIFSKEPIEATPSVSFRFVSDMSNTTSFSVLPGGPSESIFSPLYANEVYMFLNNKYKRVHP